MYNKWINVKPLPSVRLPSLGRLSSDKERIPVMNLSAESISLVDASTPTSSSTSTTSDDFSYDDGDLDSSIKLLATPNVIDIKYMPTGSTKAQSDRGISVGNGRSRTERGSRHSSGRRSSRDARAKSSTGAGGHTHSGPSSAPLSLASLPATFTNPGTSHSHHGPGTWGPSLSVTAAPIKKITNGSEESPDNFVTEGSVKRQSKKSQGKGGLLNTSSIFARKMKG